MEPEIPMLNCLLQQTLRSLCTTLSDSSSSSKWVYAVFWRVLPRNYPPPKWNHVGGILDRGKGNKRNWILVWEDGFCDLCECERVASSGNNGYEKGMFGAEIFFKLSHEVYNFGEGLVGKVAGEGSHKWVFKDTQTDKDAATLISSWNVSLEPQPRAWEAHFKSGIQTIAIISVREGVIQLGSFDKVAEDVNLVMNIQRKFNYLQTIPGIYTVQRPSIPVQNPHILRPNNSQVIIGSKRHYCESLVNNPTPTPTPNMFINLGYKNTPQQWSIPPLLPSVSCGRGAFLTKMPNSVPCYETLNANLLNNTNMNMNMNMNTKAMTPFPDVKVETSCELEAAQKKEVGFMNHTNSSLENGKLGIGFENAVREWGALNLN